MKPDDTHDQLEQYTLGALEAGEHAAVEAHLRSGCPTCRARLRELLSVSDRLARASVQVPPPPSLRARIMKKAHRSSQERLPSPWTTRRIPVVLSLAAGVLLLVWGLWLKSENARLRQELAAYADATLLLGQPGMQFVDLEGVAPNAQAFGKVVVDPQRGTGVVYMYRLPQTPKGMVYQLWVMREGRPTSAGTFTVGEDGSAVLSLESLDHSAALASFQVTIEPEVGVDQPSGMLYLTGRETSRPAP